MGFDPSRTDGRPSHRQSEKNIRGVVNEPYQATSHLTIHQPILLILVGYVLVSCSRVFFGFSVTDCVYNVVILDFWQFVVIVPCKQSCCNHAQMQSFSAEKAQKCFSGRGSAPNSAYNATPGPDP